MSPPPSAPRVKPARPASAHVASDAIDWKQYSVGLILAALVVAVFIIYRQTIHHGFTVMDDPLYVHENPHVTGGLTWEALRGLFTMHDIGNWHPVTWFSHMLDVEIFGAAPNGPGVGWHHIISVVIHATAACTLFLALRKMTGSLWRSALVAAIFALHPLRVESVAWIAERKDVLSGLFCMLTLWAYAWYAEKPGLHRYLLVVGLFALGLMSKSMLVTLPAILLLLDVWPLKRWQGHSEEGSPFPARPLKQLVLEKLPLFALSGIVSLIIMKIQAGAGAMSMVAKIPLQLRIANALTAAVMYLWQMFWPFKLAPFYPHSAVLNQGLPELIHHAVFAGIALTVVTLLVLWRWKRLPYLAVGWFWYLITLLPVIGLIQVGSQARADRYTYIPMIGIAFALVWGGAQLISRWPRVQRSMKVVLPCLLIALMVRAYHQTSLWQTDRSLFEHGCRVVENNYFLENNLGIVRWRAGALQEGEAHLQAAVRLAPDFDGANYNLGLFYYSEQKDATKALPLFEHAVQVNPYFAGGWNGLGCAHLILKNTKEGIACFRRTLALSPEDLLALQNLGTLLFDQGEIQEGLIYARKVIQWNPSDPTFLCKTAWFLATHPDASIRNGKESLNYALQAVQLAPSVAAFDALGAAYAECGQFDKAVEAVQRALKISTQKDEQEKLAARLEMFNRHQPCRTAPILTQPPAQNPG